MEIVKSLSDDSLVLNFSKRTRDRKLSGTHNMAVDDQSFSRDQQQEENNVTLEAHSVQQNTSFQRVMMN
jgi:hypothetical protein